MRAKIRAILLIALTSAFAFFSSAAAAHADTVISNPDGVVLSFGDGVLVNDGTAIRMSFSFVCHIATGDPAVRIFPFSVNQKLNKGDVAQGSDPNTGSGDSSVSCNAFTVDALIQTTTVPFKNGKADVTMSYMICDTEIGQCQPMQSVNTQIKIKKK